MDGTIMPLMPSGIFAVDREEPSVLDAKVVPVANVICWTSIHRCTVLPLLLRLNATSAMMLLVCLDVVCIDSSHADICMQCYTERSQHAFKVQVP